MANKKPAKKTAAKKTAAKSAKKSPAKSSAKRTTAGEGGKKVAAKRAAAPAQPTRIAYVPREARAIQRTARQSPYKMRLVIDQVRGMGVNEALGLLAFSKKHAAKQIEKVLRSAVANAEHAARTEGGSALDVDELFIKYAIINEGPKLKRWTPAAMGRATPMIKRTSHVEITVAERAQGNR